MRIGIISTYRVRCGIATYTNYLAKDLKAQGHEVMIFAENERGNGITGSDLDVFDLPYTRCWSRNLPYVGISQRILKWKPDVVHIQHEGALFQRSNSLITLVKYLRRNGIPVVVTLHNVSKSQKDFYSSLVSSASCTIVHSQRMMNVLSGLSLPRGALATIISHGSTKVKLIDNKDAKKYFGIPEDRFVISIFGFVGREKGHYIILSVFSEVVKKLPNAYLLLAGGSHPVLPENITNHIRSIKRTVDAHPDCMKLTGYLTDREVDLAISASDLIVFPHLVYDVFSVSGILHRVLDGGKPLVVTEFPLYDDVQSGVHCVRLPTSLNLFSMPSVIHNIVSSPKVLALIGSNAKKLAETTYWDKIAEITSVVYKEVMGKG